MNSHHLPTPWLSVRIEDLAILTISKTSKETHSLTALKKSQKRHPKMGHPPAALSMSLKIQIKQPELSSQFLTKSFLRTSLKRKSREFWLKITHRAYVVSKPQSIQSHALSQQIRLNSSCFLTNLKQKNSQSPLCSTQSRLQNRFRQLAST